MIQEYQKILSQRDFSLPKLLQNYFKSPTLHLELGLKTEGSISLEQKEKIPIENTMSENSLNLITNNQLQQKPEEKLSMQEFQQKNNQKISNDKLICSEKNSLLMNLYKILEAELTSKEKGLGKILDIAIKRNLEEVVVAYKDRLCRIGFELFEQLFTKLSNAKIVVLNESNCSPDEELAEDILTMVTVFSATINGRKRYKSRKKGEIDYNEIKNFLSQGGEQTTT